MNYYVYILTNKNHTVLYTGVTRDLIRRVYEHKTHADPKSFTAKYKTDKLVYFEETGDVTAAIEPEKQIKSWSRNRNSDLIFEKNPHWVDLYDKILDYTSYREIATGLMALAMTVFSIHFTMNLVFF